MVKDCLKVKVFELLRSIPKGKVVTYKELAKVVGIKSYRYIGKLMKENKNLKKYPCYKVVLSSGYVGNYQLGVEEKIRRLKKEGIIIKNGKIDLKKFLFKFKKRMGNKVSLKKQSNLL